VKTPSIRWVSYLAAALVALASLLTSCRSDDQQEVTSAMYLSAKGLSEDQVFNLVPLDPTYTPYPGWFDRQVGHFDTEGAYGNGIKDRDTRNRGNQIYLVFQVDFNGQTLWTRVPRGLVTIKKGEAGSTPTLTYSFSDLKLYDQKPGEDIWQKGTNGAKDTAISMFERPVAEILKTGWGIDGVTITVDAVYFPWLKSMGIDTP
jgi:hypothetical protein